MPISFNQVDHAMQAAHLLAQSVAQNLRDILAKQERVTLAVSGGRSPIAFFQALSQEVLDWSRVNITLVDERLVPTVHADSNTRLVREYLLQNHAKVARWLPMVSDEATKDDLNNIVAAVDFALQHFVQADVIVLGMGTDGHTASIFPQAPQFNQAIAPNCPHTLIHITPISAPYERISMTLNVLEKAQYIYLAIAGSEKLAVYQKANLAITPQLPISYILHSTKVNLDVFYNN